MKFLLKVLGGVLLCMFLLVGALLLLLGGLLTGALRQSPLSLGAYPGSANGSVIVH
jgi:hypothetical protein